MRLINVLNKYFSVTQLVVTILSNGNKKKEREIVGERGIKMYYIYVFPNIFILSCFSQIYVLYFYSHVK